MESIYNETDIDRLLSFLLANRLIFQTKDRFAEYAEYKALLANNPISKMPYERKAVLLTALESFLSDTGYTDYPSFFEQYEAVTNFYKIHFEGKKLLNDPLGCAKTMAYSLYHSRKKSGNKKLDSILDLLFDYETGIRRRPYIDWELLILMVLGAIPPMRERAPRKEQDPDFKKEWKIVLQFAHICDGFKRLYEKSPWIEELEEIDKAIEGITNIDEKTEPPYINRLFFLCCANTILSTVESTAFPKDLGEDSRYFELDGLWQNYQNGQLKDDTSFYQFALGAQSYDFIVYKKFGTQINQVTYSGSFFYSGDELTFYLLHPKGGLELLQGKPIGSNHQRWYSIEINDSIAPTEIKLSHHKGGNGFELNLYTLRKVPDAKAREFLDLKESSDTKIVDKYKKHLCYYPVAAGIYAITKTHLYLLDPRKNGMFYKVPKELDERLDSMTVDSAAGVLFIGDNTAQPYIGFEQLLLYYPPEKHAEYGIEWVDHID